MIIFFGFLDAVLGPFARSAEGLASTFVLDTGGYVAIIFLV
jgi:hypothetical protein